MIHFYEMMRNISLLSLMACTSLWEPPQIWLLLHFATIKDQRKNRQFVLGSDMKCLLRKEICFISQTTVCWGGGLKKTKKKYFQYQCDNVYGKTERPLCKWQVARLYTLPVLPSFFMLELYIYTHLLKQALPFENKQIMWHLHHWGFEHLDHFFPFFFVLYLLFLLDGNCRALGMANTVGYSTRWILSMNQV